MKMLLDIFYLEIPQSPIQKGSVFLKSERTLEPYCGDKMSSPLTSTLFCKGSSVSLNNLSRLEPPNKGLSRSHKQGSDRERTIVPSGFGTLNVLSDSLTILRLKT